MDYEPTITNGKDTLLISEITRWKVVHDEAFFWTRESEEAIVKFSGELAEDAIRRVRHYRLKMELGLSEDDIDGIVRDALGTARGLLDSGTKRDGELVFDTGLAEKLHRQLVMFGIKNKSGLDHPAENAALRIATKLVTAIQKGDENVAEKAVENIMDAAEKLAER